MNNNQTIIVVDDDSLIRNLLNKILRIAGFTVLTAPDGLTALDMIESTKPDLILLDIMMPGLDGNQVIQEVRQKFDVPIIMLTGKVEENAIYEALEYGADDYVKKPFNIEQ